jgi:hypothetical protein
MGLCLMKIHVMCFDVPHSARYMQEVVPPTAGVLSYVLCLAECVDIQHMEKIFWCTIM